MYVYTVIVAGGR